MAVRFVHLAALGVLPLLTFTGCEGRLEYHSEKDLSGFDAPPDGRGPIARAPDGRLGERPGRIDPIAPPEGPLEPGEPCGELTWRGMCDGEVAFWCEDGVVAAR